jgi:UDP-glucose 4-epimerase
MNKTILITWWYWYIGSHIAVDLVRAWYEIIIVDDFSNSTSSTWKWIDAATWNSHTIIEWDILDKTLLKRIFTTYQIDAVVHCAAKKAVGESCEIPYAYYETNIHGTATLLDAMHDAWVTNILFSSSTTVYDTSLCSSPFDESMPIWWTSSPYGTTKVINEMMLKDYAMHKWFTVLCLRYFNPIGADTWWSIGENPAQPAQSLLPVLLQTLMWQRKQMSVYWNDYDTPDGTCLRDYIHVSDVASWHVSAIERLMNTDDKAWREAVNLWTWKPTSVVEMIQIVEKVTWKNIPRVPADRRSWDNPTAYANPKKAKNLLWWQPQLTITQWVEDAWRFWLGHFWNIN